ncbi:MAG: class I SAM-dependent methyltransferase [Ruminococcaceae bacterium]|nr:class I SAM-dependent methyltransferase [Oscillospiraceae bacterium]
MDFAEHSRIARERWNAIHADYKLEQILYDDWLEMFSSELESCVCPIIDLGCGSGNDTKYLLERGKKVIACDYSPAAIENIRRNFPEVVAAECFDMTEGLPFADDSADLVIADLSLHYFSKQTSDYVLREIKRVLKKDGIMLARVNSVNDFKHGAGEGGEIERHLFRTPDGRLKRFFDKEDIELLFADWDITYAAESTMLRYAFPKVLWTVACRNK